MHKGRKKKKKSPKKYTKLKKTINREQNLADALRANLYRRKEKIVKVREKDEV